MRPAGSDLGGVRAVITGGGSGIGRAIAARFVDGGARVVLAGRREGSLRSVVDELGEAALAVPADVTSEESVDELFSRAAGWLGGVDVLVNSAGAFTGGSVEDVSLSEFERVMSVNVTGTFLCARAAFALMRGSGGGRVINIGSIASNRARAGSTAYSASKHAVWGLTQALALDGRADGVIVSCLNPGNTEVERRADGRSATGGDGRREPMMSPAEVAEVAALMAGLPDNVNLLEATIFPNDQPYIGRG